MQTNRLTLQNSLRVDFHHPYFDTPVSGLKRPEEQRTPQISKNTFATDPSIEQDRRLSSASVCYTVLQQAADRKDMKFYSLQWVEGAPCLALWRSALSMLCPEPHLWSL